MKNILSLFLICTMGMFCITVNAQKPIPSKVSDTTSIRLLNNIMQFKVFDVGNLSVTIIEVANPAGSANIPETEEITTNLYLAVSEIDEYPEQNLFCIPNLYGIRNIQFEKSKTEESGIVSFDYFDISKPTSVKRQCRVKVTLRSVTTL